MTPSLVLFVCVLITAAILCWDYYLYHDKEDRNSISQVVIDLSRKSPMVPALIGFFIGLLFGHFWG